MYGGSFQQMCGIYFCCDYCPSDGAQSHVVEHRSLWLCGGMGREGNVGLGKSEGIMSRKELFPGTHENLIPGH